MTSFIDTNVLVYAYAETEDARHSTAARLLEDLLTSSSPVLSVQVLKEFVVVSTRKVAKPLSLLEAEAIVRDLLLLDVVDDTTDLLAEALVLAREHQLSPWDACVVAAAASRRCEALYSEDLQDGLVLGGVRVRNPFRVAGG